MSIARAAGLALAFCCLLSAAPSRAADCASNLLIVIDRSCSMTMNKIKMKTRWDIAVDAINKMTTKYGSQLRFGIGLFPDKGVVSGMCVQTTQLLSPAPGNAAKVSEQLTANRPDAPCVTNIDEGIRQAAAEPALHTTDRRSFVLLITDGAQSSSCNGGPSKADPKTEQYIKDLYAMKIPTYVVGFDVGTNAQSQTSLNTFAKAGGLANAAAPYFIAANDETELDAALDKIAALSSSGEFSFCKGMPCPDNRCLSATAACIDGFCVESGADMGGGSEDLGDGNSDPGGSVATGCACQVGGRSAAPSALGAMLLVGTALVLRRQRRPRDAA